MDIQHKKDNNKGSFVIETEGETAAILTYTLTDERTMAIDHTEVSEKLRGQKIGRKLVESAVDYARKTDLKIISHCPYARSVIERSDSLRDLLK